MKISSRCISNYDAIEIQVYDGGTSIITGWLNHKEVTDIKKQLLDVIDDIDWLIERHKDEQ